MDANSKAERSYATTRTAYIMEELQPVEERVEEMTGKLQVGAEQCK